MKNLIILLSLIYITTINASWEGIDSLDVNIEGELQSIIESEAVAGETIIAAQINKKLEAILKKMEPETETKILTDYVYTPGEMTDLTFTGLEIGKKYRLSGQTSLFIQSSDRAVFLNIYNSNNESNILGQISCNYNGTAVSNASCSSGVSTIFTAVSDTVQVYPDSINSNSYINGDGTMKYTFLTLEKLN